MIDLRQIAEAEQLLLDIDADRLHPANDRGHRNHKQARQALGELQSKVIAHRAVFEMEALFNV